MYGIICGYYVDILYVLYTTVLCLGNNKTVSVCMYVCKKMLDEKSVPVLHFLFNHLMRILRAL